MRAKLFSLLSLSVLFLVMFMSLASAVEGDVTFNPTALTITGNQGETVETTFKLTSITATDLTEIYDVTSDLIKDTLTIASSKLGITGLDTLTLEKNVESENITLSITIPADQELGEYTGTIEIWGVLTSGPLLRGTLNISLTVTEVIVEPEEFNFCEYDDGVSENPGELDVKIKDITVVQGFGDDEEWLLLDEIEIEIEIENSGDEDVDDISVEWGLYNVDDDEWAIEMDEEDEFNLKDGDEEKLIITFRVDDNDFDLNLDELGDNYILYVRATGEVDEGEKPKTCESDSEPIQIIIEDDFIILNDFELNGFESEDDSLFPESVQCNSDIEITADVWNIGDSDQDDVYVIVYNKELGIINEKIEIGDIDAFEDEKLVFNFKVPQDLEERWYNLEFRIYDEDDDIYENDYDEEEAEFLISLKAEGSCITEPQVMVTATLEFGGRAGQELVIKATVTNTRNNLVTYTLNPEDYNEWATLTSVEPSIIILEAGESKDVLITFNVNPSALGDKLFNIDVLSDDESVIKQSVSITIEKQGFNIPGITGKAISEGNWYLWGIGALNIILVVIIILVALRVAKKKE